MYREHFSVPPKPQAPIHVYREWAFDAKTTLIIIGISLGLSSLMGLGAVLLVEIIGPLLR
jgi:hypothetical protein